jgi:hypothetical protein
MACATLNAKTGGYSFPKKLVNEVTVNKANAKTIADIIADTGSSVGVGVGVDQGIGKETTMCTLMSCSPSTISTSHTWLH